MIERCIANNLRKTLESGKAVVLLGPRQVGKSTLSKMLLESREGVKWFTGDDPADREALTNVSLNKLKLIIGTSETVVIDEAQKISGIGETMKLITDHLPGVRLLATGSSSFQLTSEVGDSLAGRKREFKLFPVSFAEMVQHSGLIEEERSIPLRMIYGYYPEVVMNPGEERDILKELSDSYLYKDILSLEKIAKGEKLVKLVQAIALQIGSQVSYNELAQTVGIDYKTVEKYIDILEKCYIVFRLPSYSRNLRNELKFSRKIYFYDLGVRNAVLGNFIPLDLRTKEEAGHLWENFMIAERMKFNEYNRTFAKSYFWRTEQQKEVDLIEELDGKLRAFEFKWDPKKKVKIPVQFTTAYPDASFEYISPGNASEFLLA
ncbi:MAG: ATP-binding protein [Bacteroidia bacterium]|nr:ATP-binding protein [Bacteroidia bacterium]